MGGRPLRSGRANVVLPSPPYWVPSNENSAVFWLIARSWPLHRAQPLGAKLPPNMRISPTKGLLIRQPSFLTRLWAPRGEVGWPSRFFPAGWSIPRGEHAHEGDAEIQGQVRRN